MSAKEKSLPYTDLENFLHKFSSAIEFYDLEKIKELFMEAPLDFKPSDEISDIIYEENKKKIVEKIVSIGALNEKS